MKIRHALHAIGRVLRRQPKNVRQADDERRKITDGLLTILAQIRRVNADLGDPHKFAERIEKAREKRFREVGVRLEDHPRNDEPRRCSAMFRTDWGQS